MEVGAGVGRSKQRGGKFRGVTHSKSLSLFLVPVLLAASQTQDLKHTLTQNRILVVSFHFQAIVLRCSAKKHNG